MTAHKKTDKEQSVCICREEAKACYPCLSKIDTDDAVYEKMPGFVVIYL
jgi:hypothetical protein